MKKKVVYVCCGTGIATSTVINKKVSAILTEHKIPFEISQWKVTEIPSRVRTRKPDIIVSSADISGDVGDVPVVSGRPFLTGLKKKEAGEEIVKILKG